MYGRMVSANRININGPFFGKTGINVNAIILGDLQHDMGNV